MKTFLKLSLAFGLMASCTVSADVPSGASFDAAPCAASTDAKAPQPKLWSSPDFENYLKCIHPNLKEPLVLDPEDGCNCNVCCGCTSCDPPRPALT